MGDLKSFWSLLILSCLLFECKSQDAIMEGVGILCYTCKWTPQDETCLTNPSNVSNPTLNCTYPTPWCWIQRQEYTNDPGVMYDFFRGCRADEKNDVDRNNDFITYVSSCNKPLCNTGDGIIGDDPENGGVVVEKHKYLLLISLLSYLLQCP